MLAISQLLELRDQRKINSKERNLYLRIGFGKVKLQVYPRRFLRARGGLLRQRCMCVNQSEYNLTFLCTLQLFSIVFNSFYRY